MSDPFPELNAELANISETHVVLTPATAADSWAEHPDLIRHKWPILLYVDEPEGDVVEISVLGEGFSDIPDDEEAELVKAYRDDYRAVIGELQVVHASVTSIAEEERGVLHETLRRMAGEDLHLLGGYVVGQAEPGGQILSHMFYHNIFNEEYKRGMLASVEASGFDVRQLPDREREYFEALARMEDTPEITRSAAAFISTLLPAALDAFPDR